MADRKAPELKKRLKDLICQREDAADTQTISTHSKDRLTGEFAMDIGLSVCLFIFVSVCGTRVEL